MNLNRSSVNAIKSWAKVFTATVLGLVLADGADLFGVAWGDFRTYIAAGLTAVLPLVITYLDVDDTRFGRGT